MNEKQPKTPLEEILFVVESTNDIVSDMSNHLQNVHDIVSKILQMVGQQKKDIKVIARRLKR